MTEINLQTFQLNSPSQLLLKLAWGIKRLKAELSSAEVSKSFFPAVYITFDCAITAWQMTDWVFKCTPDQNALLALVGPKYVSREPLGRYQAWVADQSNFLRICRYLADSNKHYGVDRRCDPNLKVSVEWNVESVMSAGMPVGRPLVDRSFKFVINDSGSRYEAVDVLVGALTYWADFLGERFVLQEI